MCPAWCITLLDRVERKIIMCCTTCKDQPELFIPSHCCRSLLKYVEPCELMLPTMCSARCITLLDRVERKIIMCCTTCKHQPKLFIHSYCCRSLLKYVEPCELMLLYNVSRAAYNIIGSRGTKNHNVLYHV